MHEGRRGLSVVVTHKQHYPAEIHTRLNCSFWKTHANRASSNRNAEPEVLPGRINIHFHPADHIITLWGPAFLQPRLTRHPSRALTNSTAAATSEYRIFLTISRSGV